MTTKKRVFIFGAGFSNAAGLPLSTELLPLIAKRLKLEDMQEWIDSLCDRLAWLTGNENDSSFQVNIEQVFHYSHFDAEIYRLLQHRSSAGRFDGPWQAAESIETWLDYLEYALCDVIFESDRSADLTHIRGWAKYVESSDTVITFNYDTLVERSLTELCKTWNFGIESDSRDGVAVCKFHGSIDWLLAHRSELEEGSDYALLFKKPHSNHSEPDTGHFEEDYQLWHIKTTDKLQEWISKRFTRQFLPAQGIKPMLPGIAGLGAYKPLHQVTGLGQVWWTGMRALREADSVIVIGFSMSDFDAMAQLQFAEVARARFDKGNPLQVFVIDPCLDDRAKDRFRRVFPTDKSIAKKHEFIAKKHEDIDWSQF